MDIIYRPVRPGEETAAAALEKECLSTPWSEAQIKSMPENSCYIGAFSDDVLCGTASVYWVAGEGQVMNVAVSPSCRRRGIGLGLMEELKKVAVKNRCGNITLEVAEDNLSAIGLYEKCGYTALGKRKNFYGNVSAVIMELIL